MESIPTVVFVSDEDIEMVVSAAGDDQKEGMLYKNVPESLIGKNYSCNICKKKYKSERWFKLHVEDCQQKGKNHFYILKALFTTKCKIYRESISSHCYVFTLHYKYYSSLFS